ncbi:DUF5110 domain-containing protein [Sphingobium sp. AN641]|uniref:DUF5110 domain-containing protein n=1 Tax=Sphingobium sp. AN641 TaxID=3133443 RepID=UPI0030BCDB76
MRAMTIVALLGLLSACSEGDKAPTQRDRIGQVWKYEAADGGKPTIAYLGSANSVATLTAPDTFAVLLVQPLAEGTADVTVKLVGAPFSCDLSDCRIAATTDDGESHEWQGRMTQAKDGITIAPSQGAYDAIRDARKVKVDLVVGPKDKTAPFEFNVAGLALKS